MGFGIPSLIHVPHSSCKSFIGAPLVSACLCLTSLSWVWQPHSKGKEMGRHQALCPGGWEKSWIERLNFQFCLCLVLWFDERIWSFSLNQILSASSLRNWYSNECPSLSACYVRFKMLSFQCCCETTFFFFVFFCHYLIEIINLISYDHDLCHLIFKVNSFKL